MKKLESIVSQQRCRRIDSRPRAQQRIFHNLSGDDRGQLILHSCRSIKSYVSGTDSRGRNRVEIRDDTRDMLHAQRREIRPFSRPPKQSAKRKFRFGKSLEMRRCRKPETPQAIVQIAALEWF